MYYFLRYLNILITFSCYFLFFTLFEVLLIWELNEKISKLSSCIGWVNEIWKGSFQSKAFDLFSSSFKKILIQRLLKNYSSREYNHTYSRISKVDEIINFKIRTWIISQILLIYIWISFLWFLPLHIWIICFNFISFTLLHTIHFSLIFFIFLIWNSHINNRFIPIIPLPFISISSTSCYQFLTLYSACFSLQLFYPCPYFLRYPLQ